MWHRRDLTIESLCLGLVAFLTLSPAFGVQYLAWAAAPAYLLSYWPAHAYNVIGGFYLFQTYNTWSRGRPWHLLARGAAFPPGHHNLGMAIWPILATITITQLRRSTRPKPHPVHTINQAP